MIGDNNVRAIGWNDEFEIHVKRDDGFEQIVVVAAGNSHLFSLLAATFFSLQIQSGEVQDIAIMDRHSNYLYRMATPTREELENDE